MNTNTMKHKWLIQGLLLLMAAGNAAAQNRQDLIAASQAGASPLFFQPGADVPLVSTGGFSDSRECYIRNGLPAFFKKANAGKPVVVGFIGGSITQGNAGYRPQTVRYLQAMYPGVTIQALNAGVSGTGTELGACRIGEQLLQHHPDLVFVEFAANGAYAKGMEGIVRQIRRASPATDICLIYTIIGDQPQVYAAGNVPENIKGLEKVAEHYGLPSIHLGLHAALLEHKGRLVWKGNAADSGRILFSNDGIHPLPEGGNLYAAAIARSMEKMKLHGSVQNAGSLPAPLFAGNWEDGGMYDPAKIAQFSGDWQPVTLPKFSAWFPLIQKASTPGASFTFRFSGSAFGIFDVGGPEAGQIEIEVNGKNMKAAGPPEPGTQIYRLEPGDSPVNRFNRFCNNRYRGQHQLFTLEPGDHTVTIRLSSQKADKAGILGPAQAEDIARHPEKYDRTVLYLGKILIKGTPVLNGNR